MESAAAVRKEEKSSGSILISLVAVTDCWAPQGVLDSSLGLKEPEWGRKLTLLYEPLP